MTKTPFFTFLYFLFIIYLASCSKGSRKKSNFLSGPATKKNTYKQGQAFHMCDVIEKKEKDRLTREK